MCCWKPTKHTKDNGTTAAGQARLGGLSACAWLCPCLPSKRHRRCACETGVGLLLLLLLLILWMVLMSSGLRRGFVHRDRSVKKTHR